MIISTFIEVAWLLWLSCLLGPRSSTKSVNGISEKVRKKLLCFFFFEGTFYLCIAWSDWRRPHKPSRKSALRLQFGEHKSDEPHLGYYSVSDFLVLEILAAGGKLLLWIVRFVRLSTGFLVWGRQHACRRCCVGRRFFFFLVLNFEMVACGINSAEGQLQSGMRSGCNGEYTCRRGSFRIDIVEQLTSNYRRQVAAL